MAQLGISMGYIEKKVKKAPDTYLDVAIITKWLFVGPLIFKIPKHPENVLLNFAYYLLHGHFFPIKQF